MLRKMRRKAEEEMDDDDIGWKSKESLLTE